MRSPSTQPSGWPEVSECPPEFPAPIGSGKGRRDPLLSVSMGGKSIVRQDLFRKGFTEFLAIVMLALISLVLAQISNLQSEIRGGEEG